jgi:hypothetical protein
LTLGLGDWSVARGYAGRAAALLERGGHARLQAIALTDLALASLDGGRDGDIVAALRVMTRAVDLLAGFGDDRPLRGLVLARRSIVLHAAGEPDVAGVLREGLSAMHEGSVRIEVPPLLEAHAALLAGTSPSTAVQLLGLARAVRDEDDNTQPALLSPAAVTFRICAGRLGAAAAERAMTAGTFRYSSAGFLAAADLVAEALPPAAT